MGRKNSTHPFCFVGAFLCLGFIKNYVKMSCMSSYKTTIGLEIHAELNTASKMFCACPNDSKEIRPNTNICPICLAHPGTLPVINKEAVHKVLMVGCGIDGRLAKNTSFDRKNYFYPDLPKGFQISQFPFPLVSGGSLAGVQITRIHLEEDTARSTHDRAGSGVDFNRSGTPLMELVTEPVIHSAQEAGNFARELQLLLRYLGVSDANMEKGQMRVEANISISPTEQLGVKVEVKNLNSFRSVERAIVHEIERQAKVLDVGGVVSQETRGWDENKQETFSQREKESAHEYRYFPEPDLPEIYTPNISEWTLESIKSKLPVLPAQRRARYLELGLKQDDANMFVYNVMLGDFFDSVYKNVLEIAEDKRNNLCLLASNYIASDLAGLIERGELSTEWLVSVNNSKRFVALMMLIGDKSLSSRGAKDVLAAMVSSDDEPVVIASARGLLQNNDNTAVLALVEEVIAEQKAAVEEYKAGKVASIQFLIGQGMKKSKGSGNPEKLKIIFEKLLV